MKILHIIAKAVNDKRKLNSTQKKTKMSSYYTQFHITIYILMILTFSLFFHKINKNTSKIIDK